MSIKRKSCNDSVIDLTGDSDHVAIKKSKKSKKITDKDRDAWFTKDYVIIITMSILVTMFPGLMVDQILILSCVGDGREIYYAIKAGVNPKNIRAYDLQPVAGKYIKEHVNLFGESTWSYIHESITIKCGNFIRNRDTFPSNSVLFTNPPFTPSVMRPLIKRFMSITNNVFVLAPRKIEIGRIGRSSELANTRIDVISYFDTDIFDTCDGVKTYIMCSLQHWQRNFSAKRLVFPGRQVVKNCPYPNSVKRVDGRTYVTCQLSGVVSITKDIPTSGFTMSPTNGIGIDKLKNILEDVISFTKNRYSSGRNYSFYIWNLVSVYNEMVKLKAIKN